MPGLVVIGTRDWDFFLDPRMFLPLCGPAYPTASSASSDNGAIDGQQGECADYRCNETSGFSCRVPAHCSANQAGKERTCNTKQDRHNDSAWIASGHHELC